MNIIKINVNKQMDGYLFSTTPSIRAFIKEKIPNAHPAINIFVMYDIESNFQENFSTLESHIYRVLLGIAHDNNSKQFDQIQFIDTQTGNLLYNIMPEGCSPDYNV